MTLLMAEREAATAANAEQHVERLQEFGREVKRRRELRGWDQKTLAAKIGKSSQHLSQIESAYHKDGRPPVGPGPDVIDALARELNWRVLDIRRMLGQIPEEEVSGTTRAEGWRGTVRRTWDELSDIPDGLKEKTAEKWLEDARLMREYIRYGREQTQLIRERGGLYVPVSPDAASDPLARIGPEVSLSGLYAVPFATVTASAGAGTLGTSEAETETLAEELPTDVRAIRVRGDSMEPFFQNGDVLIIRETPVARSGQKVIAFLPSDEIVCKIYCESEGNRFLEAANGRYPKITGEFKIIGVVEAAIKMER